MTVHRRAACAVLAVAGSGWLTVASGLTQGAAGVDVAVLRTSAIARQVYLGHAVLWQAGPLPSVDQLLEGPPGIVRLDRRQANPPAGVPCTFERPGQSLGGKTDKFQCRTAGGVSVRVKYYSGDSASGNREVFAEVVATRLFWALGYSADVVVPVTVNCLDCPADPMTGVGPRASRRFLGVVEPQFEGAAILSSSDVDEGWTFDELDEAIESIDVLEERERQRAHYDSLTLLAAFVKHGDRKPSQQRLVCVGALDRAAGEIADLGRDEGTPLGKAALFERPGARACVSSKATIQDLGATFGGAGRFTKDTSAKLDLSAWSGAVFRTAGNESRGPRPCEVKLVTSLSSRRLRVSDPNLRAFRAGSPRIGETGRRHLAERLSLLSDAHIRALFESGRVDELGTPVYTEPGTNVSYQGIDAWVAVFKRKRAEIVGARCTSSGGV